MLKAWRNVRGGLIKVEPTIMDEILKQPLFGNPHIPNLVLEKLNTNVHVGKAMALARCACIKNLWNPITHNWKDLKGFSIRHTMVSIVIHNNLMMNILWDPSVVPSKIVLSD
jgi:hypothetical protein